MKMAKLTWINGRVRLMEFGIRQKSLTFGEIQSRDFLPGGQSRYKAGSELAGSISNALDVIMQELPSSKKNFSSLSNSVNKYGLAIFPFSSSLKSSSRVCCTSSESTYPSWSSATIL